MKLAACGFKNNQLLSKKFFILYELCEEQLSKQVHYDFGLRNILAVLRTLGTQRRSNPTKPEETILMRVLKDMNVSKLVDQDETIFLSLIDDLFDTIKSTTKSYKDLQVAIASSCAEKSLINHPSWNLKIIQVKRYDFFFFHFFTIHFKIYLIRSIEHTGLRNVFSTSWTNDIRPHWVW